jgi:AcrR family transcriptional regulator
MCDNNSGTLQKIITEGKKEFLEKGFEKASLRSIVKRAGVTTGAFYGYFPDKQSLFEALVSPAVQGLKDIFVLAHNRFHELSEDVQKKSAFDYSVPYEVKMIDYIYAHFDQFRLLITCAGGTVYSGFINSLVETEVESKIRFVEHTKNNAIVTGRLPPELIHIISSAYFSAVFETVAHNMPRKDADMYIISLRSFFTAGWKTLLGPQPEFTL